MSQPPPAFPQPPYPPPRTNGLGIAGFIVSILGIFSVGLLSPIGLFLSFIALFRSPRGFAFAGFVLGLVGTLFIAAILTLFGWGILKAAEYGKPMIVTVGQVGTARQRIESWVAANGRQAPDDVMGQSLIGRDMDGWGRPLLYRRVSSFGYEIRSAGSDGLPYTDDDFEQIFDVGR